MAAPHPSPLPSGEKDGVRELGILVIGVYLVLGAWNMVLHHSPFTAPLNIFPLSL